MVHQALWTYGHIYGRADTIHEINDHVPAGTWWVSRSCKLVTNPAPCQVVAWYCFSIVALVCYNIGVTVYFCVKLMTIYLNRLGLMGHKFFYSAESGSTHSLIIAESLYTFGKNWFFCQSFPGFQNLSILKFQSTLSYWVIFKVLHIFIWYVKRSLFFKNVNKPNFENQ